MALVAPSPARRFQVSPPSTLPELHPELACFDQRIVIEIDGSQRFESHTDKQRDAVLADEGFRVLRYWNNDGLQNSMSVLEDILNHLTDD